MIDDLAFGELPFYVLYSNIPHMLFDMNPTRKPTLCALLEQP